MVSANVVTCVGYCLLLTDKAFSQVPLILMVSVCLSIFSLPFDAFSSNLAIQCTEVYEYALSLGSPQYTLPSLQMYKYLYTLRLVDAGFIEEVEEIYYIIR